MEACEKWSTTEAILGPALFIIFISDLKELNGVHQSVHVLCVCI